MELWQLRYFVKLAETLNFHQAAQQLHIAQPGLSRQIQNLEDELGVPLFVRNSKVVALTDSGRLLLPSARSVLRSADEIKELMMRSNDGDTGKVSIGRRCVIKANSTVGSEGFSFIFDKNKLEHFPQIGGITIGDDVWIGANSTIERAALDDTVIEEGVKVDDLVQIGHNTRIGKFSQITAGAVICGRVVLGERCWVAPKACIDNAVVVGKNALIGMGAVVLKDVPEGMVVAGVPAKVLRKNGPKE